MRNYPRNSPHAAARLVALALIADGHACRTEFEALARLQVERELGLPNGEMARIVQDLCEDLLLADDGKGALGVGSNDALLADLLTEIDDLDLERERLPVQGGLPERERVRLQRLSPGGAIARRPGHEQREVRAL